MTDDKDIQELLRRKERAITTMGGLDKIAAQHRRGRMTARERVLAESPDFDTAPWGAAGQFHVDDVIDPRSTRAVIPRSLEYACGDRFPRPVSERPLLSWPLRL